MTFQNEIEEIDVKYIHKKARITFEKMSGNHVLLTGGSGFLSYYFIKSIVSWNEQHTNKIRLTVFSRFSSGIPGWLKELGKQNEITIKKQDVTKMSLSEKDEFDYIIHAASIASPIFYRKYPLVTMHANVEGLEHLLQYSVKRQTTKNPVIGILYFSSSEIYGDPTPSNIPTPETYRGNVSCTGPRACYDESKRYCETLCVNYVQVHDLPIKVARPFNNYGPGLGINDGRVIPDFAKNILEGKDIMMFSNGSPKRTFCYVADAVVGYLKLLTIGPKGQAYNIGVESPEISIRELAQKMIDISKKEFGYTGKIVFANSEDEEYLTDNPQRRCPIITKARKDIGYDPEITLDEGLRRSLLWYAYTLSS